MRRVELRNAHPQSLIVVLLLTIRQRDAMSWRAERASEAEVFRSSSRMMREWWAADVCKMNCDNGSVTVDTCWRGSRDGAVVLEAEVVIDAADCCRRRSGQGHGTA